MSKQSKAPGTSIISLPDKRLREISRKIGLVTEDVRATAKEMEFATLDWEDNREHEIGVALAAVQMGIMLRLVVVRNNFEDKADRNFQVLINPVITKLEGEVTQDYEGCLSVPDIYGRVPRHTKIRVKALDLGGKEVRFSAEGFLARVLQHEIDHCQGKVFIDLIKDSPEAFYRLQEDGKLVQVDYEKEIKQNSFLW